jgi:putative ABC transport system permease protein
MSALLLRAGARYHMRHRLQLALAVVGVLLGVAVVVAVDVAAGSSRRAFTLSTEAVTGRATHELIGGPAGIRDSVYGGLRRAAPAGIDLAPVLDRYVTVTAGTSRRMRLLGIDPFAEAPFRTYAVPATGQLDTGVLLTQRSVMLSVGTAASLGLRSGDTLRVASGTGESSAVVGGVLEPEGDLARRALDDLLLADISTAQELTGATGVLDRIEVQAADAGAVAALTAQLPPQLRIMETDQRAGATARLTRAFETNLTALALIALVFGMFLIYNSVSFSVVQRRRLLGLLRAQGVTARELFGVVIAEAAILGVVATALGLAVGAVLGAQLVRLVAGTVNDLYFAVSVTSVELSAFTITKAVVLGVGATVVAAAAPAAEAVRTPPRASLARAVLERRAAGRVTGFAAAGLIIAALSTILLVVPSRSIVLGFAALFILILAAALLTPAVTTLVIRALRPLAVAAFGPIGRIAARGVTASLSRTAPAIAALGVAVSVGIAVTLMIVSFRAGVAAWLEQTLQADIYISAPGLGANRTDVTLDPQLAPGVAALPGVAGISTYRHATMLLDDDLVRFIAIAMQPAQRTSFPLLDAVPDPWQAFNGGALLVSEPLAYRRGLRAGDALDLPTDRGTRTFTIAAVFRDYASEHGVVFIDRGTYSTLWDDASVTSLAVFLTPDHDVDHAITQIRALPAAAGIIARPNRGLRDATLEVFDRTFLITGVLRLLALLVAFVGVTGALMALQLERSREIAILRATGLTPGQVWSLGAVQTALMGVAAVALAVPLGSAMAWAMVHVINRRSFGWTFDLVFTGAPFVEAAVVGIAAALLGGLYPAYRMSRMRPATALCGE